jgi:hypothetical protein
MKLTPVWIGTFETRAQTIIQDAWEQTARKLIWDRFMDVKQSGGGVELYFWLIENAGIELQGQGGNQRIDDIAAHSFEVVNEDSGKDLELTKNEINDNQMANPGLKGMPALEYAAGWARDMGNSSAYWPQKSLFRRLIPNGTSTLGYDGVAFFSTSHPINVVNSNLGTYANLFTGAASGSYPGACPIDSTNAPTLAEAHDNLARAVAYIESLLGPHGEVRNLVVKYLLAPTNLRKRSGEVLSTKYFGTGQGSTENVISTWGIEPIIAAELAAEPNDYYLVCEWVAGQGGPFIFQNREPYVMNSYAPMTQLELQRQKKFVWSWGGRNGISFGHPYLIFKVKAT